MRTRLDAGTHPTFCTIQFLEDVDRSDPASRRSGRLLVGMRRRWLQAHPEVLILLRCKPFARWR